MFLSTHFVQWIEVGLCMHTLPMTFDAIKWDHVQDPLSVPPVPVPESACMSAAIDKTHSAKSKLSPVKCVWYAYVVVGVYVCLKTFMNAVCFAGQLSSGKTVALKWSYYKIQSLSVYIALDKDRHHSLTPPRQLTCKAQYVRVSLRFL